MPWKQRNLSFKFIQTIFQNFSNISNISKIGLNEPKTLISLLPRHTQLSPIILTQIRLFLEKNLPSFSVLYSLQSKIGVRLLKVELTQLLTPAKILPRTTPLRRGYDKKGHESFQIYEQINLENLLTVGADELQSL